MAPEVEPMRHELLGDLQVLLHGVPCKTSRGWLGYCSIVLIPLEEGWALFDTGHYSDRSLLLQVLKRIGLSPLDIRSVFVSHLHFDHILNLSLFKNASLKVAKAEIEHARRVSAGEVEDTDVPENWQAILDQHEVDLIEGPQRIDGRTEVEVLPGHTPGGLVVYRRCPETVAVCGDVIKNAWDAVKGEPGVIRGDFTAAGRSIRHVLEKSRVIIPGHDRPFSIRNGALEFLAPFSWQVSGSLMPGPQDEVLLDIRLPEAVVENPLVCSGRGRREGC